MCIDDQYVTLTSSLSYGEPDNADNPANAVGLDPQPNFFHGVMMMEPIQLRQVSSIPAGYRVELLQLLIRVTENSASPWD
jgi:hypothetical protein